MTMLWTRYEQSLSVIIYLHANGILTFVLCCDSTCKDFTRTSWVLVASLRDSVLVASLPHRIVSAFLSFVDVYDLLPEYVKELPKARSAAKLSRTNAAKLTEFQCMFENKEQKGKLSKN